MAGSVNKIVSRDNRARRVRFKIAKTGLRIRLTVHRSNRNISAQIVDDTRGVTLVSASTLDTGFRLKPGDKFDLQAAKEVGRRLADRAREKDVAKVVFDRGPYLYHGKVKALADGAREGGLKF
jgi:large subunit ribosomal protein L18